MHEVAIAQNLLAIACEEAARAGARRVTRVECRIGELRGVDDRLLQDAWRMGRGGTLCGTARLKITRCCPRSTCPACGADFPVDHWTPRCPACGVEGVSIEGGDELELTRLCVDLEDTTQRNPLQEQRPARRETVAH